VAAGKAGVFVMDITDPERPATLADSKLTDARALALAWPHLFIADYADGMMVLDVADARRPRFVAEVGLANEDRVKSEAQDVTLLVLPSRPPLSEEKQQEEPKERNEQVEPEPPQRTLFRVIAAFACGANGLQVVNVTDPRKPHLYGGYGFAGGIGRRGSAASRVTAVAGGSKVDLGSTDGGIPTAENDYLYATSIATRGNQARLMVIRVTDPRVPERLGSPRVGRGATAVSVMNVYNPPFLQNVVLVASGELIEFFDVTKSELPEYVARFGGMLGAQAIAVESMPLDQLVDEAGRPQKDISHAGRFFSRQEIDKILRVDVRPRSGGPVTPGGRAPKRSDRPDPLDRR